MAAVETAVLPIVRCAAASPHARARDAPGTRIRIIAAAADKPALRAHCRIVMINQVARVRMDNGVIRIVQRRAPHAARTSTGIATMKPIARIQAPNGAEHTVPTAARFAAKTRCGIVIQKTRARPIAAIGARTATEAAAGAAVLRALRAARTSRGVAIRKAIVKLRVPSGAERIAPTVVRFATRTIAGIVLRKRIAPPIMEIGARAAAGAVDGAAVPVVRIIRANPAI